VKQGQTYICSLKPEKAISEKGKQIVLLLDTISIVFNHLIGKSHQTHFKALRTDKLGTHLAIWHQSCFEEIETIQNLHPSRSPQSIAQELLSKYSIPHGRQTSILNHFPQKSILHHSENRRILKLMEVFVQHNLPLSMLDNHQFREYHTLLEAKSIPSRKKVRMFSAVIILYYLSII
jgi:hypothetical protein